MRLHAQARITEYRNDLFAARNALMLMSIHGSVRRDRWVYREMRSLINTHIQFAHRITPLNYLVSNILFPDRDGSTDAAFYKLVRAIRRCEAAEQRYYWSVLWYLNERTSQQMYYHNALGLLILAAHKVRAYDDARPVATATSRSRHRVVETQPVVEAVEHLGRKDLDTVKTGRIPPSIERLSEIDLQSLIPEQVRRSFAVEMA